jgi:ParB-like chromosome segregation protein Spo0J
MSNLHDPFNPKTGEFRDNIRMANQDDSELRESLKRLGWCKQFPAIADENGVILVGHRRMKVAKDLGIAPVIQSFTFGSGDAADAERLKIALASNIGGAPMTKDDRRRMAEYLYGSRDWTMERIAEALNVTAMTVSRDLGNFNTMLKLKASKTTSNPKGAGRPKGSKDAGKARRKNTSITAENAARSILDQNKSYQEIEKQTGFSNTVLRSAVAREEGRREAELQVAPDTLSMTAQQKLDAAIRQHKHKLDAEFEMRVLEECKHRLDEISLPHYAKQITELEQLIRNRKGVMDRLTYKKILACLHPDRVQEPALKKRYEEAFRLFADLEKRILDEKQSPTQFQRMPRTYEELMAMKARVQAARRAKRSDKSNVGIR